MNIDENADIFPSALAFTHDVVSKEYSDAERTLDTYTFLSCIKSGVDAQTYEDKPYLIPYLVDESDSAIIVVPGGAFGYKSITAGNNEGNMTIPSHIWICKGRSGICVTIANNTTLTRKKSV